MIGMAVIFLVLFIVDLVMTLSLGEASKYLEANLIFKYVGFVGIAAYNIIIIAVVYWLYQRSRNPTNRFYMINLLVTLCVARVFAIYNNYQVLLNPPTLEQAKQITQAQLVATATNFAWISLFIAFLPYLITVLVYNIWKIDHKIEVKEK